MRQFYEIRKESDVIKDIVSCWQEELCAGAKAQNWVNQFIETTEWRKNNKVKREKEADFGYVQR
jgi:hypothetical protein